MIDQVKTGSVGAVPNGESIRNPRLQGILRYWNALRGPLPMPSLRQIDPIEIPNFLPIVLVADVLPDGTKMRLLGTDATNGYGRETRGNDVRELELGEFSPLWREAFALVRASGMPTAAFGPFRKELELLDVEVVLAPLSDDGTTISHILGGLLIRPAPCVAMPIRRAEPNMVPTSRLSRTAI